MLSRKKKHNSVIAVPIAVKLAVIAMFFVGYREFERRSQLTNQDVSGSTQ
jgi:hypothetical protein